MTLRGTTGFDIIDWLVWREDSADQQPPDVSMVPPMLRRRLSTQGRAAFSVMMPITARHGAMPLVYVSRHGEVARTLNMLSTLARGELLSPAAFSLSVHNATAGLFSIQQQLTASITAIAAGAEDLVPALLEAVGQLASPEDRVLCVFCDEPIPKIYTDYCDQPSAAFAMALVLGSGQQFELGQLPAPPAPREADATSLVKKPPGTNPQCLLLADMLQHNRDELAVLSNNARWRLRRKAR